jgi:hypothetical protein
MAIAVVCECGKKLNVPDDMAGKRVKCPACQATVAVPGAAVAGPKKKAPQSNGNADGAKKSSKMMLWLALGVGALLLGCCCLGGVGVGAYFLFFTGPRDKVLAGLPVEEKGVWTTSDPRINISNSPGRQNVPHKGFKIALKANTPYLIELESNVGGTEPWLLVQDSGGKKVAEDANFVGPIRRANFTPSADGDYRIVAANCGPGPGEFVLRVKENKGPTGLEKTLVGRWEPDDVKKAGPFNGKIEFKEDWTITDTGLTPHPNGRWRVTSIEGKVLHVEVADPLRPANAANLDIIVVDDNHIRFAMVGQKGPETERLFKRSK